MHVCGCAHSCVHMQAEVTLRRLPQSLASVFPCFLSEFTDLVRLRSPPPHLYLLSTGVTCVRTTFSLYMCPGVKPGSSCLHGKHFANKALSLPTPGFPKVATGQQSRRQVPCLQTSSQVTSYLQQTPLP